ncbi:Pisatin demethylase [Metarhizium anisopliae]
MTDFLTDGPPSESIQRDIWWVQRIPAPVSTGILAAIRAAVRYAAVLGLFPKLHRIIVKASVVLGIEAPIISLLNTAERAARNYSNSRADPSQATPHAPFLEQLFRFYDEKKADFRAIHDCCSSNIAAGSDTTAINTSAALYFLHHEPDRLAKLREEIDGAVKDSEFIKVDDALAMPYLIVGGSGDA